MGKFFVLVIYKGGLCLIFVGMYIYIYIYIYRRNSIKSLSDELGAA